MYLLNKMLHNYGVCYIWYVGYDMRPRGTWCCFACDIYKL